MVVAIEPTKVIIDEVEYAFHHISVKKLNRLLIKLVKIIGEPLPNGMDDTITDKARANQIEEAKKAVNISLVVKSLSNSLDEVLVEEIINGVLEGAVCSGIGPVNKNFEKVFGNKSIAHHWKVVLAALKHYFGDFFSEGLGLAETL